MKRGNRSPTLPRQSRKRKRREIAESQSEEEEGRSDLEFGWAAEDEQLHSEQILE